MPTNDDSFVITAAMLAYAYVKPTVSFTTVAGKATMTDAYLPATHAEFAGAPGGVSAAVSGDTNYAFARTMKVNLERTPYPTGLPGDVTSSDVVAAVECNATLSVTNVES